MRRLESVKILDRYKSCLVADRNYLISAEEQHDLKSSWLPESCGKSVVEYFKGLLFRVFLGLPFVLTSLSFLRLRCYFGRSIVLIIYF